MAKKAYLVTFEHTIRVIADPDVDAKTNIIEKASDQLVYALSSGIPPGDHVKEIEEDKECPYGSLDIDSIS